MCFVFQELSRTPLKKLLQIVPLLLLLALSTGIPNFEYLYIYIYTLGYYYYLREGGAQ